MSAEPPRLRVVVKCETTSAPVVGIIAASLLDIDTGLYACFGGPGEPGWDQFVAVLNAADEIIHFGKFHIDKITKFLGVSFDPGKCLDVQGLAQKTFAPPKNGLDAWAVRLGLYRKSFRGADRWSRIAADRCLSDVRLIVTVMRVCAEDVR